VAGSCECGDEPSGTGATELVYHHTFENRDEITSKFRYLFSFILPIGHATVTPFVVLNMKVPSILLKPLLHDASLLSRVKSRECALRRDASFMKARQFGLEKVAISFIVLA
jgi:hypothetical protein